MPFISDHFNIMLNNFIRQFAFLQLKIREIVLILYGEISNKNSYFEFVTEGVYSFDQIYQPFVGMFSATVLASLGEILISWIISDRALTDEEDPFRLTTFGGLADEVSSECF